MDAHRVAQVLWNDADSRTQSQESINDFSAKYVEAGRAKWQAQTDLKEKEQLRYEEPKKYDSVSNPVHYIGGRSIEPINVIEEWQLGYHLGNALKYISRAGRKGSYDEDLRKAIWYLERALKK